MKQSAMTMANSLYSNMTYWSINEMNDKRIIFYDTINQLEDSAYLTYYLKYQLAPVIMGHKPSITLSLGCKGKRKISKTKTLRAVKALGLSGIILRETPTAHIVLIYQKDSIERILKDPKERIILEQLNYPIHSVYAAIAHLRKRYDSCHCPPELGTFLGFPVEDVRDYMCGTDKKCLLCGYWKVFNNLAKAQKIFKSYDQARDWMLQNLLKELQKAS